MDKKQDLIISLKEATFQSISKLKISQESVVILLDDALLYRFITVLLLLNQGKQ